MNKINQRNTETRQPESEQASNEQTEESPRTISRRDMLALFGAIGISLATPNIAIGKDLDRPGKTEWKVIRELDSTFMNKVDNGTPIALLIGTKWCGPCKVAAKYWEERGLGPFEAYDYVAQTDEEWDNFNDEGLLANLGDSPIPIMALIHRTDKTTQTYRHQCVLKVAGGLDECTEGIAKWLNENNY